MPGKKSRKFIDKRKDVVHSFKLVQRSQQDPLIADESAPQGVLLDSSADTTKKEKLKKFGVYFDDEYNYLQHLRGAKEAIDWDNAELEVYTIRKKDSKIGSKRLRNAGLQLPSSVFESYVEEPVGLLNKAAPVTGPQPDLDPDVVAGLDRPHFEEGDESDLPDNFVSMLNSIEPIHDLDADAFGDDRAGGGGGVEEWLSGGVGDSSLEMHPGSEFSYNSDEYVFKEGVVVSDADDSDNDMDSQEGCFNDSDDSGDEARDEVCSLNGMQKTFRSEETKSCFTNYSLSSSVIPRTELLSLLDDRFEEKFLNEYDDEHMGALDGEDIDGFVGENSELFLQAVKETRKDMDVESGKEEEDRVKMWVRRQLRSNVIGRNDTEEIHVLEKYERGEQWDCESILSTYSNIYNHPRSINTLDVCPSKKKIVIDSNTGMPVRKRNKYLNRKNLQHLDTDNDNDAPAYDDVSILKSLVSAISIRPKDETPEERRLRKMANKEYRKARRDEKKMNRLHFKEEKKIQQRKLMQNANSKSILVV